MKKLSKTLSIIALVLVMLLPTVFMSGCGKGEISCKYLTYDSNGYGYNNYTFNVTISNNTKEDADIYCTDFVLRAHYKNTSQNEIVKQLSCQSFTNYEGSTISIDKGNKDTAELYFGTIKVIEEETYELDYVELLYKNKVIATNIVL